MTFADWLRQTYGDAVAYLPGWSDDEIMECDLVRLELAVKSAVKRLETEQKFQMAIHGIKVDGQRPPPRNAVEQDERVADLFASLGTVKVERDA